MATASRPKGPRRVSRSNPAAGPGARCAQAALVVVILSSNLLVDTGAEAAFDAPKRLVMMMGTALGAAALLAFPDRSSGRRSWAALTGAQKSALVLVAAAIGLAVLSAFLSPRQGASLRSLPPVLTMALLLPLGASRALAGGSHGSHGLLGLLLGAFLAASALNGAVSALERLGWLEIFAVESVAGRGGTGAFVGNEGSLALTLALAAVAAFAVAAQARTRRVRIAALGALALHLAGLLANPSLTAVAALLAGGLTVGLTVIGRRVLVMAIGLAVLVAAIATVYTPLRTRVVEASRQARVGNWDALLTYRFGPWAAAFEMTRERPLLGFGPGTFGAEFVPHRLRAELRYQRRLLIPRETSSYGEAHSEFLQVFAEAGGGAGLAVLAGAGVVLVGLALRVRGELRGESSVERREAVVTLGLLVAGAVGALTWFPLQQAASAPALLLTLGRGWSLLGARAPRGDPRAGPRAAEADVRGDARAGTLRWLAVSCLLVAVGFSELPRYTAERALHRATRGLKAIVALGSVAPPDRSRALEGIAASAMATRSGLPDDRRPLLAAGGAHLLAGNTERALERYADALAQGERAEIDLNIARAYALEDRRPEAFSAFVRTAWVSPALLPFMPEAARPLVRDELARLEYALARGQLASPPPPPPLKAKDRTLGRSAESAP